jgi:hypothetical protein
VFQRMVLNCAQKKSDKDLVFRLMKRRVAAVSSRTSDTTRLEYTCYTALLATVRVRTALALRDVMTA